MLDHDLEIERLYHPENFEMPAVSREEMDEAFIIADKLLPKTPNND